MPSLAAIVSKRFAEAHTVKISNYFCRYGSRAREHVSLAERCRPCEDFGNGNDS
jgi:hypothetical protein